MMAATAMTATRRTTFAETMTGSARTGERERPMRMDLVADLPGILFPWSDLEGTITGRVVIDGLADDAHATGTLRVAPLAARRIRYRLDFTAGDGRRLHLDGWKSITMAHPVRSMTLLPATVTDDAGTVVGEARLRFDLRRDLARFLAGFRFPAAGGAPAAPGGRPGTGPPGGPDGAPGGRDDAAAEMFRSRWRGQPGRLEVWYSTLTDPATGTGVWLHHELVAPAGGGPAKAHGWATVFPPGAAPVFARFGPHDWPAAGAVPYAAGGIEVSPGALRGTAGDISWDLTATGGGTPLYTFPRWSWERELLPAAQVVPAPTATYEGTVRYGDTVLELAGAPGNTARIYGHGNAKRWAWLHADLGGGDVCEVVAAVSMRPGLNRLPPLPLVRLRVGGTDWPLGDPLVASARMRADIGLPRWTVRGRSGDRRIDIEVTQPPEATVAVDYADPDGAPAVCRNTERADAVIVLRRRVGRAWEVERRWELTGTAHAEVGTRE